MSYTFLSPDNIQIREVIPFPANGGLDLVTDKLSVYPGTLQDCINYEVSRESGYSLVNGLLKYSGKHTNVVNEWYEAATEDNYTSVLKSGGEYYYISPLNEKKRGLIKVLYISPTSIRFQVKTGDYTEKETLVIGVFDGVDPDDPSTVIEIAGTSRVSFNNVPDFVEKFEDTNKHIAATSFRPPGQGPITALFELKDKIYAARTADEGTHSDLFTTTDVLQLDKNVEWEKVDLGWLIEYEEGGVVPLTIHDREYLDDSGESANDVLGRYPSSHSSIETANTIPETGQSFTTKWTGVEETLYAPSPSSAAAKSDTRLRDNYPAGEHFSQILRLRGFNSIADDVRANTRVKGIKLDMRVTYTAFPGLSLNLTTAPTARMTEARLVNVGGSNNKAPSGDITLEPSSSGPNQWYSPSSTRDVTLGGESDTWGASDIFLDRVLSPDFGVEFEFSVTHYDTIASLSKQVWVHHVIMSVYLEDGSEEVFFWDGTDDVASGKVSGYTTEAGLWEENTAEGIINLYEGSSVESISEGDEIRTGEGGSGFLIGKVASTPTKGSLPSWEEMENNKALSQVVKGNFSMDEDKEAIYGVTGAGPAFSFDGRFFTTIRAPVPRDKDKPRHIAIHADHLVLGYAVGSILVSVVGDPYDFRGVRGASEFGFGDVVTGLMSLNGNSLGVFCEQSTHALVGNTLDNFTTQIISKSSGALEYTVANMGQPIYLDFRGISNINATNQYGDFFSGRLSQAVSTWLQPRIQDRQGVSAEAGVPVMAIPVRNKNQYRVFFRDGKILTMTLFGTEEVMPMFTLQDYTYKKNVGDSTGADTGSSFIPTASLSSVVSDGTELLMIGTSTGDVYCLDQGTGVITGSGIIPYDAFIEFNPFNGDAPITNLKYSEIHIHGLHSGYTELVGSAGVNYLVPEQSTTQDAVSMGRSLDKMNLTRVPNKAVVHLPSVTAGYSLRIDTTANGDLPHVIQALTYRVAAVSMRNDAPKRY